MAALVSGPPLSYNGARAGPPVGKPQRRFCEICGYWGTIKCIKCGARVCGLECTKTHSDGRCIFYS
jgi:zinc finger HIT domain-containing protein 1